MKIGLTSGCFDLIHYGHIEYLRRCKDRCDKLLVGIDSDEMVKEAKGHDRPIISLNERHTVVNRLDFVHFAFVINSLKDLHDAAVKFKVNYVFKHEGFKNLDNVVGVKNTQAELVIIPDVPGLISTTEIIDRIRKLSGKKSVIFVILSSIISCFILFFAYNIKAQSNLWKCRNHVPAHFVKRIEMAKFTKEKECHGWHVSFASTPYYRYKNKTEATIFNPYFIGAKLLLKCDWDGKVWRHQKEFKLKRKGRVTISVPNGSRCQIWPSIW